MAHKEGGMSQRRKLSSNQPMSSNGITPPTTTDSMIYDNVRLLPS